MIYIHFIVNPISGNGKHNIKRSQLQKYFPRSEYRIETDFTKYKLHAVKITKHVILQKPDVIVACGGDGTINEIASCLIRSDIKLGIIPVGSGNGLASNLKIENGFESSLEVIKRGITTKIDVGQINEHYFFSNAGIGVVAEIIKKFDKSRNRNLLAYIKATLSSAFNFKAINTILNFNQRKINVEQFMILISNSNEMGFKMTLTPKASLNDGWLDLVIFRELSTLEKLKLGLAVLNDKTENYKKAERHLFKTLQIEMPHKIFTDVQIDGEYYNLKTNVIDISIVQNGLTVIS